MNSVKQIICSNSISTCTVWIVRKCIHCRWWHKWNPPGNTAGAIMIFIVHLNCPWQSVGVQLLSSSCCSRVPPGCRGTYTCRDLALPASAELTPLLLLIHCREGHGRSGAWDHWPGGPRRPLLDRCAAEHLHQLVQRPPQGLRHPSGGPGHWPGRRSEADCVAETNLLQASLRKVSEGKPVLKGLSMKPLLIAKYVWAAPLYPFEYRSRSRRYSNLNLWSIGASPVYTYVCADLI